MWWWCYIVLWSPSFWHILIKFFFPYLHVIGSVFRTPFGDDAAFHAIDISLLISTVGLWQ